jgi:hypothetical protein
MISGEWCQDALFACASSLPTFFDLTEETTRRKEYLMVAILLFNLHEIHHKYKFD